MQFVFDECGQGRKGVAGIVGKVVFVTTGYGQSVEYNVGINEG